MPESKPSVVRADKSAGAATQAAPATGTSKGDKPYATITVDFYDDRGMEVNLTGDRPLALRSVERVSSKIYRLVRSKQRAISLKDRQEKVEAEKKEAEEAAKAAAAKTEEQKAADAKTVKKGMKDREDKAAAANASRGASTR